MSTRPAQTVHPAQARGIAQALAEWHGEAAAPAACPVQAGQRRRMCMLIFDLDEVPAADDTFLADILRIVAARDARDARDRIDDGADRAAGDAGDKPEAAAVQ